MKTIFESIYDLEVRSIHSMTQRQNPIEQGNYRVSLLQVCEDGDFVRCEDVVVVYNLISSSVVSRLDSDECREALRDPEAFVLSLVEAWVSGLTNRRIQRFRWELDRPVSVQPEYPEPVNILCFKECEDSCPMDFIHINGIPCVFNGEIEASDYLLMYRRDSLWTHYIIKGGE